MQQYRVGRLVGSPGRAPPSAHDPIGSTKQIGSNQTILSPWAKLAVSLFTAYGAMTMTYRHVLPRLEISQLLTTKVDLSSGHGFLTGIVIASSMSFVGFRYLYKLFLSSLDYQNDVFSFPPTIPRKARR